MSMCMILHMDQSTSSRCSLMVMYTSDPSAVQGKPRPPSSPLECCDMNCHQGAERERQAAGLVKVGNNGPTGKLQRPKGREMLY